MRVIPVIRASVSSHLHSRKNVLSSSGFIMVIELSGVQFGLKSYAWFRNCARVRFEITSMISDQNCTTRSSITTLLHPFWNHSFFFKSVFIDPQGWFVKRGTGNAFTMYMYMPCQQNKKTVVTFQKTHWSAKTSFMQTFKQFWNLATAKIVFFKV